MRVLVLDSYYRAFWREHYGGRPGLVDRSYADQLRSLMARLFGTSDAYSHHLRRLGHDACEVVVNCVPLQAAWAREHRIAGLSRFATRVPGLTPPAARAFLPRVLIAQIDSFDPDVVYVQDLAGLWHGVRRHVRRRGCLLVAQLASIPPPDAVLRDCDLVITSCPHWVDRLRDRGVDCEYLPLAFDERVLDAVASDDGRIYPVTFVGTLRPENYSGRAQAALERACARLKVSVWGAGAETLPPGSAIIRDYRGEAWGRDMYAVLGNSSITVNRHGDIAEGRAINMRMYEATGMGAVLLTEAAPNLPDLFEPGREVIAYESPDDLVVQAERLLGDPDERREIAEAGQRRTLSDHTYARRMPRIVELVEARLR